MAFLKIVHNRHFWEPRLPHLIFIDDRLVCIMRGDSVTIELPNGSYALRIQCGGRIVFGKKQRSLDLSVSSTSNINISQSAPLKVSFCDQEKLWNLLFDIDLLLWIVSLFATFPPLYNIISNAFFAIWLLRLIIIRKKYYRLTIESPQPQTTIG